ncbi:ATP-dependent DNA ligase [Streptomyces sp. NPDC058691]|uniref:ATP-dependent DNA ligase n=1 Tax=Streptomyces sp. NPDC058691 TaxID=3346601 RepID=UPI00365D57FE
MTDPVPPPVVVMLARRVETVPEPDALPGGCAYEPKFDGHRMVVLTDPVRLQTRSGRIVTDTFPELAEAARALPPGTVVDGEVVIWRDGRIDFGALQRRALGGTRRRPTAPPPANYAAFDLLAAGGTDLRGRPYDERRAALTTLLAPLGPPLQPVPMTTERDEALHWYASLAASGIEGLVVKGRAQRYRPGRRDWLKLRHSVPQDAVAIGFTGTPRAPRALVLDLGDGPLASAALDAPLRAQLAPLLTPSPRATAALDDGTPYRPLPRPLPVEILQGAGRHALTTVLRLRPVP